MNWIFICTFLLAGVVTIDADCGKPDIKNVRVIGGKTAARGSWPWQILMIFDERVGCGGSLISPLWVVTAAHCVYGRSQYTEYFTIRVGEHHRHEIDGSEIDMKVTKIIPHPQYDPSVLSNDVALIKLASPVLFNKYVKPVCLPKKDPPVGTNCYITGWGKIRHPGRMYKVLQQGRMAVVDNTECQRKNMKHIPVKVNDGMVCAGDGGKTKLSGCHGDSGGPFVCYIDEHWELHGAVSYGSSTCNSTETYTVFSRINYFKDWIKMTMMLEG